MKFGKKSIINAEGSILAHTLRLKASIIKKGTILSANDIKILGDEGYKDLMVASLEIDDIGENDAAKELALTTAGLGVIAGKPFTGRCNLFASYSGLFIAEKKLIDSINLVDESMTLGTLAPYSAVETGQMVATIKVIPFSAPKSVVLECNTIARKKSNLLEVKPWKELRISLIQSILPKTKTTVLNSTAKVLSSRLKKMNNKIYSQSRCKHDQDELCKMIKNDIADKCDLIILSSASAIVDRRDIIPKAIKQSGGIIEHFGMPVDPGNLLLLGNYGKTQIIGLPGCARSPKLNGFDWVLERILAGLVVSSKDLMLMGSGGLLTEIFSRPMPRHSES